MPAEFAGTPILAGYRQVQHNVDLFSKSPTWTTSYYKDLISGPFASELQVTASAPLATTVAPLFATIHIMENSRDIASS